MNATFPADEGQVLQTSVPTSIPIFDDDVNEAADQFFIAHLVVGTEVNSDQVKIERSTSICKIVDNDRE